MYTIMHSLIWPARVNQRLLRGAHCGDGKSCKSCSMVGLLLDKIRACYEPECICVCMYILVAWSGCSSIRFVHAVNLCVYVCACSYVYVYSCGMVGLLLDKVRACHEPVHMCVFMSICVCMYKSCSLAGLLLDML
jgi:hypothetical protein